jgi:enamine deaminase RidA (YjgF/YER057c/UK114 family)
MVKMNTATLVVLALAAGGLVVVAAGTGRAVLAQTSQTAVKKEFVNPTKGRYSGAVIVHGNGVKTIYVSGQVGRGEDFKAQAASAYANLLKVLAAAGAKPEDVVKLNTYIAKYTPEDRAAYEEARRQAFPQDNPPASTMVGVESLISPQMRIEVEAVAVVIN